MVAADLASAGGGQSDSPDSFRSSRESGRWDDVFARGSVVRRARASARDPPESRRRNDRPMPGVPLEIPRDTKAWRGTKGQAYILSQANCRALSSGSQSLD